MLAGGLLLAAGCVREPVAPGPVAEEGRAVTVRAELPETRVAVDVEGKVTWVEGDAFAVYNTAGEKFSFTLSEGAGTASGTFTCADFTGTVGAVAVYPYAYAGDGPGTVVLPARFERADDVPAVMASQVTMGADGMARDLHFRHLGAVVELTLHDIPAYARALVLKSADRRINGTFSFDPETLAPFEAEKVASSTQVTFPYTAGYGRDLRFCIVLPAGTYAGLGIGLLDGDETYIEGLEQVAFSASSRSLKTGGYLRMPVLDVRSRCTRPSSLRKVEGVCWAAGNLRAWADGPTGDGWQEGWNVYEHQWDTQYGLKNASVTGASVDFTLDNALYKTGSAYTHFDYFSWGTIGRAARVHNQQVTSSVANFDLTGKVFRRTGTATSPATDISTLEELSGDERFEASPLDGSNPLLAGDVAFWASKGQYRLPTRAEMGLLYSKAGSNKTAANLQVGWYRDGDHQVNGLLFTSSPSWADAVYDTTPVEFTDADLEAGLFLPRAGERTTNVAASYNSTQVHAFNAWAAYWTGTFGEGSDAARVVGYADSKGLVNGYTPVFSKTTIGQTLLGNCIRPVLNSTVSAPLPDPEPAPEAATLPAWSPGYLDIHAINSGAGECTFIILPDGTSMMVDAGEIGATGDNYVDRRPTSSVRAFKVYTAYARYFLQATGHRALDYFLLTHYHADHMGAAGARFGTSGNGYCRSGVMAVYDDLPFKKLVDRLGPSALPTSGDYSEAVFEQYRQFAAYRKEVDGMEWYALNLNAPGNYNKQFALKYDPSYDCRVTNLGGNRKYWNGSGFSTYAGSLTENGLSATILVSYGDFDYYTGADCACQTGVMQQIASGLGRPVDAMKAGHHLYYDTIDAATAAILQPQVTIAQILDKDKPGDPAFSLYRQQGDVFCTNLHPWRLKPVSELAEGEGIKAGTLVEDLAAKVKDYGGHFVIRVSPGGSEFYVYKLRDTDFSYAVEASYGPYHSR